jgi:hypothetical protein
MGPLAAVLIAASACASKGPPPRVAEVPIDDGTPTTAAAGSSAPGAGAEVTGDPAGSAAAGGGGGGGGAGGRAPAGGGASAGGAPAGGGAAEALPVRLPTMLPAAVGVTDVPAGTGTPSSKPLPPKAERLSASDCNKIMDKYIELVGISQGISPDAISGVMEMLRNSVSSDPSYTSALGACAKENTKTQYRCAMRANDVDGWKKCLQ